MYCINCGKKINDADNFCPYCGKKKGIVGNEMNEISKSKVTIFIMIRVVIEIIATVLLLVTDAVSTIMGFLIILMVYGVLSIVPNLIVKIDKSSRKNANSKAFIIFGISCFIASIIYVIIEGESAGALLIVMPFFILVLGGIYFAINIISDILIK